MAATETTTLPVEPAPLLDQELAVFIAQECAKCLAALFEALARTGRTNDELRRGLCGAGIDLARQWGDEAEVARS